MALIYYTLASILILILLTRFVREGSTTAQHASFPKGPKPLPYLGNLHQMPLTKPFLTLTEWSRSPQTSTPDGLIGLHLGPKNKAVVLNKWTQVRDLFDSRGKGAIYADRPYIPMVEYVIPNPQGKELHVAFAHYGVYWRRSRRTIVEFLTEKEVDKLAAVQEAESTQMMWELLNFCGSQEGGGVTAYRRYVLRYFGAIILASVFGLRAKDSDPQSLVTRFFTMQDEWSDILAMGKTPPLDIFPWLRYIPDFLTPWKGWRANAEFLKKRQSSYYHELFAKTAERVKLGKSADCFIARLIRDQDAAVAAGRNKDVYTQLELDYIGGFMMEGGADTTATALETFILAMAAYPHIQKRAQEEVDRVFESETMPQTAEEKKLPFLKACFLETLRWRPPLATGIPHANTADDTYQGRFIPKGTTIIPNVWAISHDPDEFDDPDTYNPERYLVDKFGVKKNAEQVKGFEDESKGGGGFIDEAVLNASEVSASGRRQTYAFGAGRRVCAGQRMAERSSILTMSKLMWCFDVVPGSDKKPDVEVRTAWRNSLLAGPKLFPVKFVPRDEKKRQIIAQEWEKADKFLSRFE